jgi:mono/diheme cytochrome c family protein
MDAKFRISWPSFLCGGLLMLALLGGFAGWLLHRGFSAREKPSSAEAMLAGYALRASSGAEKRDHANPVQPSAAALDEARDHFADHCASCHANNGSGHTMYGNGLNPPPPDMRLAATQGKSDGELYSIIKNGVRMSGMPAFGEPGDNDLSTWKLVLFVRHLPSLTPEEELLMQKANPISPSELKEQQGEDDFLHGTTPK